MCAVGDENSASRTVSRETPPQRIFPVTRKTGQESFTAGGQPLPARLEGFWSWSCSNLLDNALRGRLAEYLVGIALGCVDRGVRLRVAGAPAPASTGGSAR
ncbi:MAG: hypothetical protein EOP32_08970 [Rhodococcus sp. (in: high G+C Gram-positive bacteria)]|nr:MAG: hypothetical protein EOP32_08970 [Rhodococcus sp. (in: high G+C Gram-positive bacteria)]